TDEHPAAPGQHVDVEPPEPRPAGLTKDEWTKQYNEGRERAPHRTVALDDADVLRQVPRTHEDGRPAELGRVDGRIHYDVRRMEVQPGHWVREHTVKLHLAPADGIHPARLEVLKARLQAGVDEAFNHQHRLPGSGDQLHVRVEFHDDPRAAHETIAIDHE